MVRVDYDPASLCGPVDQRIVRTIADRHGKVLDPSYLAYAEKYHGGIPARQFFTDVRDASRRIGRLLPLVDNHSELEPPFRRSREFLARDARIDWGVLTLIEEEGPTALALFGAEKLMPFAALYRGSRHPDTLSLGGGDTNLLAFLYEREGIRPQVVVWLAREAQHEFERWARALGENRWHEPVRYDAFVVRVAQHFDDFLEQLRLEPDLG